MFISKYWYPLDYKCRSLEHILSLRIEPDERYYLMIDKLKLAQTKLWENMAFQSTPDKL